MNELFDATRWGDIGSVRRFLEEGVDCNVRNENDDTPLQWAAECGHTAIVALLLEKGANCNVQTNKGNTPLHGALHSPEVVTLLIKKGAKLNEQNQKGQTPLHWAVEQGYTQVGKLLLENHAIIHMRDQEKRTPLYWAAHQRQQGAIQLLLSYNAYSYEKDDRVEELLSKYWEASLVDSVRATNELFYKSLLLAGISTVGKTLSEPFCIVRQNIEITIGNWFSDLHFSTQECHEVTPAILKALPYLIRCVKRFAEAEGQWKQKEKHLKSQLQSVEGYTSWLKHFLLLPEKEVEANRECLSVLEELERRVELQSRVIPLELLTLIREIRVLKLLAATLIQNNPILPERVANYMVEDGMACLEKYNKFLHGMLRHHWKTPYLECDRRSLNTSVEEEIHSGSSRTPLL